MRSGDYIYAWILRHRSEDWIVAIYIYIMNGSAGRCSVRHAAATTAHKTLRSNNKEVGMCVCKCVVLALHCLQ